MELSFEAIPVGVEALLGQPGHGLLHGGGRNLSVAAHQGLQDSIMNEGVLILHGDERKLELDKAWPQETPMNS